MINIRGPRVTWIEQPQFRVKVYEKAPHGRQSVQVFSCSTRPWHLVTYQYFGSKFEFDARDINSCNGLSELQQLLKQRSDQQSRAV